MNAVYVTSIDTFSGKTAFCVGLARRLQQQGKKIGYLKPVSFQPIRINGTAVDEDADFVTRTLHLEETPAEFSPVVVTTEMLEAQLRGQASRDYVADIVSAFRQVSRGKDLTLLEGAGSLREGYVMGLSAATVSRHLGVPVLGVIRWSGQLHLVDDALTTQTRLGNSLLGIVFNGVPQANMNFVNNLARPYLEQQGISVFGVLPNEPRLLAVSVGEITDAVNGEILVLPDKRDVLAERLMVGSMSVEAALPHFRRVPNKVVITGGDRTDLQLAALETSTRALVLSGNLRPNPQVLQRAEELGVPVVLARGNTLDTIEAVDRIFGRTHLGQPEKLEQFEKLLSAHLDFDRLFKALGVNL